MLSKMSAFADISPIGDKKSSRTFQRKSYSDFLSEGPPARVPLFQCREATLKFTPPALCGRKEDFRALRSASRGAAPTPRKPSRRLDPSFVSWCASKFYVNITKVRRSCILTIRMLFHGNTHRRCEVEFRPSEFNFTATAAPLGATIGMQSSRQCSPQAFIRCGSRQCSDRPALSRRPARGTWSSARRRSEPSGTRSRRADCRT